MSSNSGIRGAISNMNWLMLSVGAVCVFAVGFLGYRLWTQKERVEAYLSSSEGIIVESIEHKLKPLMGNCSLKSQELYAFVGKNRVSGQAVSGQVCCTNHLFGAMESCAQMSE
jgi:hypothetical protein